MGTATILSRYYQAKYGINHRLGIYKPLVYIDSQLGNILITRFLMYEMLIALLEHCVLCIFYFPVIKIFMSLLGFEHGTFNLEKNKQATNVTTLLKRLCNRVYGWGKSIIFLIDIPITNTFLSIIIDLNR